MRQIPLRHYVLVITLLGQISDPVQKPELEPVGRKPAKRIDELIQILAESDKARELEGQRIIVTIKIDDEHKIFAHDQGSKDYESLRLMIELPEIRDSKRIAIDYPPGKEEKMVFGTIGKFHKGKVEMPIVIKSSPVAADTQKATKICVTFKAQTDIMCYPTYSREIEVK